MILKVLKFLRIFFVITSTQEHVWRKLAWYIKGNGNAEWHKHVGSLSWVGYINLKWNEVVDRPNWKDRPPDLFNSNFLKNIFKNKLHVIGNIS